MLFFSPHCDSSSVSTCTKCFCSPFQQRLFYVLSSVVLNDLAKKQVSCPHWRVVLVPPRLYNILRNSPWITTAEYFSRVGLEVVSAVGSYCCVWYKAMHLISSAPCLKARQCVCTTWPTSSQSSTGPSLTERGPTFSGWRSRDASHTQGPELWVHF